MPSKKAPPSGQEQSEEPQPDQPQPGPPQSGTATPGPRADDAPRDPRFFAWIRSLGLVRRSGWLGGVCAAIADRTRLDPILVRGIVVVLAVLGAPVVLLYAAAWLLLPDEKGAIHALTLARGRVESAVVAIAGLVLLSFLPLTQGFWWAGAAWWGEPDFGASAGRILWTLVVIAAAIVVIVWLARRAAHPDVRTVPATTDDRPETVPAPPAPFSPAPSSSSAPGPSSTEFAAVPAVLVGAGASPAAPPPAPPSGAGDAELAAWRVRQEQWKQQRAAWAAQQRAEDRARRAAEQAARGQEREAQLAERRRREPFVGGAVIGIVLGLAVIAGCAVGLIVSVLHPDRAIGWTAGLGAAVVVFGLALAIAGAFRRRAGGIAAFAVLALIGAVLAAPLAADRQFIPFGSYYGIDTTHSGRYARLFGTTELIVRDAQRPQGATVDVWQRTGDARIEIEPGQTVRIVASLTAGDLATVTWRNGQWVRPHTVAAGSHRDGIARYDVTYGSGAPDVVIRMTLESGSIAIGENRDLVPQGDAGVRGTSSPSPTPTSTSATSTEGARP